MTFTGSSKVCEFDEFKFNTKSNIFEYWDA